DADRPREGVTLWRYFHTTPFWDEKNHLLVPVLVFDQFEEMFTLGRGRPELDALWTEIADLAENRIPRAERAGQRALPPSHETPKIKVVLALREDYLPDLDDRLDLLPSAGASRYRLKQMDGAQALSAVVEPLRV